MVHPFAFIRNIHYESLTSHLRTVEPVGGITPAGNIAGDVSLRPPRALAMIVTGFVVARYEETLKTKSGRNEAVKR